MNIYFYIDKVVNFFLMIYNKFSYLYSLINPKLNKCLKRNSALKKKRHSDECYILGNGPSIKNVDFEKLMDKETFTVNWFYEGYHGDFVSRYFVAVDTNFLDDEKSINYIKKLRKKFKNVTFILKYNVKKNGIITDYTNNIYYIYPKQFQYDNYVQVDCTKNMTACINVVLQCIQIAIYMGYKKIYLLGCDFNQYATLKVEHFSDVEPNGEIKSIREDSMGIDARWSSMAHFHHYALRKYADEHGIEIINLTPGSLIDAYKRDTLENVIS